MTPAARLVGRAAIRRHLRAIVAVMLLIGVAGTIVVAAAAGARRTATALRRFDAFSAPADLELAVGNASRAKLDEFESRRDVAAVAELHQVVVNVGGIDTGGDTAAMVDARFGRDVDRALLVRGRIADNTRADEINLSEAKAAMLHADVSSVLVANAFSRAQIDKTLATNTNPGAPAGPTVRLHVVGIVRRPVDLSNRGANGGLIVFTPAFGARYGDEIGSFAGTVLRLRVRDRARLHDIVDDAQRLFAAKDFTPTAVGIETAGVQDAINVAALALAVFVVVAGLAMLVFVGIVMTRQIDASADQQSQLVALGLTRRERIVAAVAPAVPMVAGGSVVAVVGAVLASPLFPFGVARRAEPHPGLRIDAAVLGIAWLSLLAVGVIIAVVAAIRTTRVERVVEPRATSPSRVVRTARSRALPPAATAGLAFALEPRRGRTSIPVRSAFAGAITGVVAVAAVLVFATSLDHLVHSPSAYGSSWDVVVGSDQLPAAATGDCDVVAPAIVGEPALAAVSAVCDATFDVEGRNVQTSTFHALRGTITPVVSRGRLPERNGEIAIGHGTLAHIHKAVGGKVVVRSGHVSETFAVVGESVLPPLGETDPPPLADNALVTPADFGRLRSESGASTAEFGLVATLAPGVRLDRLPHDDAGNVRFGAGGSAGLRPTLPVEIDRLRQINRLPALLAIFVAFLAVAALSHAAVVTMRRRRRDIAVLRVIGFRPAQVRRTMAWQAATFATVGIVVGVPVGVVAGRAVWNAVCDSLGVARASRFSLFALLVVSVSAVALAVVIGSAAGARAGRMRPARALATE